MERVDWFYGTADAAAVRLIKPLLVTRITNVARFAPQAKWHAGESLNFHYGSLHALSLWITRERTESRLSLLSYYRDSIARTLHPSREGGSGVEQPLLTYIRRNTTQHTQINTKTHTHTQWKMSSKEVCIVQAHTCKHTHTHTQLL